MNDLQPMDTKELSERGFKGISATVGGVAILVLKGIAGMFGGIVGVGIGVIAMGLGISGLKGHTKTDKTGGAIAFGTGALFALAGVSHWHIPFISALAGIPTGLVTVGAIGLIGYGLYNAFRFIRGLRHRA
ncbi:MAG: hypothetical protein M0Z80_14895 [Treponema sp.]|nr:hypothetical protein [Treponema sp.]